MGDSICPKEVVVVATEQESAEREGKRPPSPVLTRLIEEIRIDKAEGPNAYNRMHNRHNRSR